MGQIEEARATYEASVDVLVGRHPSEWDFSIDATYLSELAWRLDDRTRMPAIYDMLSSLRSANVLAAVTAPVVYFGPATLWLGMLAARAATQVRVEQARMLIERGAPGDRELAAGLLDRATQDAERIGFVPMLEDARALRASL